METNQIYKMLLDLYPNEAYSSYANIFGKGAQENIITEEEYEKARLHYGNLWHYTGD